MTDFTGKISKEAAFELLDAFVEAGGNFIDTANLYHFGESEEWIGEWMEARGNRDRMVIATKYSGFNDGETKDVNSMGNSVKSMHLGVRESLKRLRTSYIDVFYVHFWWVPPRTTKQYTPNNHVLTSRVDVAQGLHDHRRRDHAWTPPTRHVRRDPLPRHQRYPGLDRLPRQRLCQATQLHPFRPLSGALELVRTGRRAGDLA